MKKIDRVPAVGTSYLEVLAMVPDFLDGPEIACETLKDSLFLSNI